MAFINKSIIFALALSSLLSLYVEATSRALQTLIPAAEKVDPTLERLCFSAEFPHDCSSAVMPYMSGTIDSHSVLQAGLKLINQRSQKAIEQAENLKKESKSKEVTAQLDFCIQNYRAIGVSTKEAAEALPDRKFNKLESELDSMVAKIHKCEVAFAASGKGGKSRLYEVNTSLRMAAKNNLNIGNFVAMPVKA